jgi:hypothetical protein
MDEHAIRSAAALDRDGNRGPVPDSLAEAMVWFERRYGGLLYRVIGGNGMEYGLDGEPTGYLNPHGLAFTGVIDGDWTWPIDVPC